MTGTRGYYMETVRLGFGRWSLDDLPLAVALWGDAVVTRWIGGPFSRAAIEERLQREMNTQRDFGIQYWPLFLRSSGEFAGCGGLRPYRAEEKIFELGIHLRPAFWNTGLAEEACRVIIAAGFEDFGANALFAGHHPENSASRRLLEKLGFEFTHQELYPPTGLLHPSYLLNRPAHNGGQK